MRLQVHNTFAAAVCQLSSPTQLAIPTGSVSEYSNLWPMGEGLVQLIVAVYICHAAPRVHITGKQAVDDRIIRERTNH